MSVRRPVSAVRDRWSQRVRRAGRARRRLALAVVAASVVTGACGREPTEVASIDGNDTFRSVRTVWYHPHDRAAYARPAVSGAYVIVGTGDARVLKVRASTGEIAWTQQLSGRATGANIVLIGETAILPSGPEATALDVGSGAIRWTYTMPMDSLNWQGPRPATLSSNSLHHDAGRVYLPGWGGIIAAVDVASGREAWLWRDSTSTPFWRGTTGVRVAGDTLYASLFRWRNVEGTDGEGLVVALDRHTGRELWRLIVEPPYRSQGTDPHVQPAVWRDLVYVAFRNGTLVAIDRFRGVERWRRSFTTAHALNISPEIAGDVLYHYGADQSLYAMDPADGRTRWSTRVYQLSAALLITERRVYAIDASFLGILNRQNGRFVARVTAPRETDAITSSAVMVDGVVVIGTSAGTWAFREP